VAADSGTMAAGAAARPVAPARPANSGEGGRLQPKPARRHDMMR
jgi:hypothetical protein